MNYIEKPITAVWEITFACNMRCKHCGSSCDTVKPDELTTKEALNLADQIGEMGLAYITLSGGEPLLRKDWHLIAKRLKENKVIPNMITNGWSLTTEEIKKAKDAGISNIAISLDGLKSTHDFLRKEDSFNKIMSAFEMLKQHNMPSSAITTVNTRNIVELTEIKDLLIEKGIVNWQLQYAMQMGNLLNNIDLPIQPEQIDEIIDFAYNTYKENKIRIDLADCIGYYNNKEVEIRNAINPHKDKFKIFVNGCPAGKKVFGIRYNGDIIGCTSIRFDEFIEGNIRNTSLKDLWNSDKSFQWNRNLSREQLTGFCSRCQYGSFCLAGCTTMKFTSGKTLKENEYCSFNVAVKCKRNELSQIEDEATLKKNAYEAILTNEFQLAELYFERAIELEPKNIDLLNNLGYVYFQLGDYKSCIQTNNIAIKIDAKNAYAHKGIGLGFYKSGKTTEGIYHLSKAIEYSTTEFMDPYHDLAVVYYELGQPTKALEVLEEGRKKSTSFRENSEELYKKVVRSCSQLSFN